MCFSGIFPNRILDHRYGYEEVTKQCGAQEVNGLEYKEGCETSKIPFKRKQCYCKKSLCNSGTLLERKSYFNTFLIFCTTFFYSVMVSRYF